MTDSVWFSGNKIRPLANLNVQCECRSKYESDVPHIQLYMPLQRIGVLALRPVKQRLLPQSGRAGTSRRQCSNPCVRMTDHERFIDWVDWSWAVGQRSGRANASCAAQGVRV